MELARTLKDLLKKRNMTVSELAKATNVPVNTLHNWIAGQAPRNLKQVKKVADYFSVTVDYLAFGVRPQIDLKRLPEILLDGSFEVILRPIGQRD